jgi:Restriction endonuclease
MEFLKNLNNVDLDSSLKKSVRTERKILRFILAHIVEVEARKMYLAMGFESLHKYLVDDCGYTGSAANRRIEAAGLMAEIPSIGEKIQEGSLNLTQIGEVHRAIKEKERISDHKISTEEKVELVEGIVGLNGHDTQRSLSSILEIPVKQFEKVRVQADGSVIIEMSLSKEDFENLKRCKELEAQKLAQQKKEINLSGVIGLMAAERLDSKSTQCRTVPVEKPQNEIEKEAGVVKENKTVTPLTRTLVFQKSECCEFRDPRTGRVCGSKFASQVDHKISRRMGGGHSVGNLQNLCARHNRFKYEKEKEIELRFFG